MRTYDIAIVGGGITGLALACALAQRSSLSIVILDAKEPLPPWLPKPYQPRVSAITLASRRIFQSLGVWEAMQKTRVSPFERIDVWDAKDAGEIHFNCREIGETELGYIIENELMQTTLYQKVKTLGAVEVVAPVKLVSFKRNENSVEITAESGEVYQAQLAVAADGANSWLRNQLKIEVDAEDYAQSAIVTTVKTELAHNRVARQVFLPEGPLAFLPLVEPDLCSIVWSLPADTAQLLLRVNDDIFREELAQAFGHKSGAVIHVAERYAFPLRRQMTKHYITEHVALVGDAAHTVHPLAGQGVNMGLLDAASLVDVLTEALGNKRSYAAYHTLRRYERWRKADNVMMFSGIDLLKKLFASENPALRKLLSLGLNTTDRMRWIKNIFTRYAVGDRNGLPSLARK